MTKLLNNQQTIFGILINTKDHMQKAGYSQEEVPAR